MKRALGWTQLPADGVCLLGFEIPDQALVAAARCAADAGMRTIIVDPAPARKLPDELIDVAPLLTPNAGEATALTGERYPVAAARALSAITGSPVIVTLGREGAALVRADEVDRFGAPAVRAVDSTGAGDVFNGVLAASLAQGAELTEAVPRAVAAAASSVQRRGARFGPPRDNNPM